MIIGGRITNYELGITNAKNNPPSAGLGAI